MRSLRVYILKDDATGLYKVGVSRSVRKRARTFKSRLLFSIKVKGGHMAEAYAHRLLKPQNVYGEWFATSFDAALRAVKLGARYAQRNYVPRQRKRERIKIYGKRTTPDLFALISGRAGV